MCAWLTQTRVYFRRNAPASYLLLDDVSISTYTTTFSTQFCMYHSFTLLLQLFWALFYDAAADNLIFSFCARLLHEMSYITKVLESFKNKFLLFAISHIPETFRFIYNFFYEWCVPIMIFIHFSSSHDLIYTQIGTLNENKSQAATKWWPGGIKLNYL